MVIAPAIGQEELWDELLDICWVTCHTLPRVRNAVEQPVCHIKPAVTPHSFVNLIVSYAHQPMWHSL